MTYPVKSAMKQPANSPVWIKQGRKVIHYVVLFENSFLGVTCEFSLRKGKLTMTCHIVHFTLKRNKMEPDPTGPFATSYYTFMILNSVHVFRPY